MSPNWHILPVSFNTNQRFTVEYSDTLLGEMLGDKDPEKSKRVMESMLQMDKIDIERWQETYEEK